MAADRWWSRDRPGRAVGLAALAVVVVGGVALIGRIEHDDSTRTVQQSIDALAVVHVPGSERHTAITSSGCGGYQPPVAHRTDWSTRPPAEARSLLTTEVTRLGWSPPVRPGEGFGHDGMRLTMVVQPTRRGGSKVTVSITSASACASDQ